MEPMEPIFFCHPGIRQRLHCQFESQSAGICSFYSILLVARVHGSMAALRDALAEVVVEDFEEAFTKRLPLPRTPMHGNKIWPIVFSQGSWF